MKDCFIENGMNVVSNEGLLIHSSEKVRLVVDVLRYLIDINDDISKLSIINYLQHKKPKSENLIFLYLKIHKDFDNLLSEYKINIDRLKIISLQLYELVESLYKTFGIIEDIYTNFFLDIVLKYSEKNT